MHRPWRRAGIAFPNTIWKSLGVFRSDRLSFLGKLANVLRAALTHKPTGWVTTLVIIAMLVVVLSLAATAYIAVKADIPPVLRIARFASELTVFAVGIVLLDRGRRLLSEHRTDRQPRGCRYSRGPCVADGHTGFEVPS